MLKQILSSFVLKYKIRKLLVISKLKELAALTAFQKCFTLEFRDDETRFFVPISSKLFVSAFLRSDEKLVNFVSRLKILFCSFLMYSKNTVEFSLALLGHMKLSFFFFVHLEEFVVVVSLLLVVFMFVSVF